MMTEGAHDISTVANYFADVNYPSRPLHDETKAYLKRFFQEDGLIRLCDRMFGKYYWKSEFDRSSCWMDTANRNPKGAAAAELFKLLCPGSPFLNLLEAFSAPSPSFSSRLKSQFDCNLADDTLDLVDFPFSSLYQFSTRFLSESFSMDVYDLPRSACPAFLMIPFWVPPLVTRKELSQLRILSSLRCKPLQYFFIRLIFYIFSHGICLQELAFTDTRPRGNSAIVFLKTIFQSDSRLSTFPFYYSLTTAYIQFYVTPALAKQISNKRQLEDVFWSTTDTTAGVLLCYSYFLNSMCFCDTDRECCRGKRMSKSALGITFCTLPLLLELFVSLHRDGDFFVPEDSERYNADYRFDSLSRSSYDIIDMKRSLFRNSLIAIRETLISLDDIPICKVDAICNILRLWKCLMNPLFREGRFPNEQYIYSHLEAYIYITVDVLFCLSKSSFFRFITADGAATLKESLEFLVAPPIASVLEKAKIGLTGFNSRVMYGKFSLNWQREDGSTYLPNIFNAQAFHIAARTQRGTREAMEAQECPPLVKSELENIISLISKIFPNAQEFSPDVVQDAVNDSVNERSNRVSSSRTSIEMHAHEPLPFLRGRSGIQQQFIGRSYGTSVCRDELPVIAAVLRYVDCCLAAIQETLYTHSVPKCLNGHKMWLVDSKSNCSIHPRDAAIWSCQICDVRYCLTCTHLPVGPKDAVSLEMKTNRSQGFCAICSVFLDQERVAFYNSTSEDLYCSKCASRSYLPWSTRWMASYRVLSIFLCFVVALTVF